jgi:hypothetical protein
MLLLLALLTLLLLLTRSMKRTWVSSFREVGDRQ